MAEQKREDEYTKSKYSRLRNHNTSPFESVFSLNFKSVELYLLHSQYMIEKVSKNLNDKIDEWDANMAGEIDIDEPPYVLIMESGMEEYWDEVETVGGFKSILYNSTFILVYSWFEIEFFALCEYCKEEESLKLGVKDITGKGYIGQCKRFITHLLGVDLGNINDEWSRIVKYQHIRNSIVHKRGEIRDSSDNGKDLIEFINQTDGIKFTTRIEIESIDFIIKFNNLIVQYLEGLIGEILRQKT